MPAVYEHPHVVADREIDGLGHANNLAYIAWMLEAAVAHSDAQGWTADRYRREGVSWVVRSHHIDYLNPARAGDAIRVRTWVADMKSATSLRRTEILRASDGALLARASTDWAFIDLATGAPKRIPPAVSGAFTVVEQANHGRGSCGGQAAER